VPQAAQWKVGYAGVGTQTAQGQWPDNAGCVLKTTTVSNYAYSNAWTLSASIKGGKLQGIKTKFLHSQYPSGFGPGDTSASVKGSNANKPDGEHCQWSGGPDNTGTFDCQAKPAPIEPIKELRLPPSAGRLLFRAGGMIGHSFTALKFTGQDTVPQQQQSSGGCGYFDSFFDSYWPLPAEAEVSVVPVKVSTLIGLRRNHFFEVNTSPGHYAPAEAKTCLPPLPVQDQECAVTERSFRGELKVRRIR
jgi:hypothetical protein